MHETRCELKLNLLSKSSMQMVAESDVIVTQGSDDARLREKHCSGSGMESSMITTATLIKHDSPAVVDRLE